MKKWNCMIAGVLSLALAVVNLYEGLLASTGSANISTAIGLLWLQLALRAVDNLKKKE